jgi:hypothetical protein
MSDSSVCQDLEDAVLTLTLTFKRLDSRVGRVIAQQGQKISRQAMFPRVSINSPRLHRAQRLRNSSCHTISCCALQGCQSTTELGAKSNHWTLCFSSEAQRSVVHGRQSLCSPAPKRFISVLTFEQWFASLTRSNMQDVPRSLSSINAAPHVRFQSNCSSLGK